jgi:single-strand DNA-binding protein
MYQKVIVIGNLGVDPELRYTPSGKAVAHMRVAANRRYKDADGQVQQETEWFRIVAWNRLAETCNQYLAKGRLVYVEGRLQTRSFEGSDGNMRYVSELVASTVKFLDRGNGAGGSEDGELVDLDEGDFAL